MSLTLDALNMVFVSTLNADSNSAEVVGGDALSDAGMQWTVFAPNIASWLLKGQLQGVEVVLIVRRQFLRRIRRKCMPSLLLSSSKRISPGVGYLC